MGRGGFFEPFWLFWTTFEIARGFRSAWRWKPPSTWLIAGLGVQLPSQTMIPYPFRALIIGTGLLAGLTGLEREQVDSFQTFHC